jgi:hypothetical protein
MSEQLPINQEFFEQKNQLADQLADTNLRTQAIPELGDAEFEAIATEALTEEQQGIYDQLTAGDMSQYEDVVADLRAKESIVEDLETQIADARNVMTEEQKRYDDLVTKLATIAPLGESKAKELAERRKGEIELANVAAAREQLAEAELDVIDASDLFVLAGKAWPIPLLAVRGVAKTEEFEGDIDSVDEIPIDPVLRKSDQERVDGIRNRNIDAPEASAYITFFLADNSGKVVTVDELVGFLYGHVNRDERDLRSRITTMLGPKVQGQRIQKMLTEEDAGYLLQYGWRRDYDSRNKRMVGPQRRIYRALRLDEIDSALPYILNKSDKHADTFETNTADPESEVFVIEEVPAQKLPVGTILTPETPAENVLAAPETPAEAEAETIVAELPIIEKVEQEAKPTPNGNQQSKKERRTRETWQTSLRRAIGEAINQLEADGLMGEEDIAMDTASRQSSSNIFGTLTALERLESAGVVSVGSSQPSMRKKFSLTPQVRVMMSVFNTQSQSFLERNRRAKAMNIVDEAIASYRRHQAEQQ